MTKNITITAYYTASQSMQLELPEKYSVTDIASIDDRYGDISIEFSDGNEIHGHLDEDSDSIDWKKSDEIKVSDENGKLLEFDEFDFALNFTKEEVKGEVSGLIKIMYDMIDETPTEIANKIYRLKGGDNRFKIAANQLGWKDTNSNPEHAFTAINPETDQVYNSIFENDWERLCDQMKIEPADTETCENWMVSEKLAELLSSKGQIVEHGVADFPIWTRHNKGELHLDDVILEIAKAEMDKINSIGDTHNKTSSAVI